MTPKTKDSNRLARLGWVQCKGQPRPNQLDLDASDQNWIPLATSSSMKSLRSHFSYVLIDSWVVLVVVVFGCGCCSEMLHKKDWFSSLRTVC